MEIVGVDEVGRGALAGPVCVGLFRVSSGNATMISSGAPFAITDSKQVTEKRRQVLSKYFLTCKKQGLCDFVVMSMSAEKIDQHGISICIKKMIEKGLEKLSSEKDTLVLLDGGLHAPTRYNQKTIIKGDVTEFAISCASILAKVYRDTYMKRQAELHPAYGFENHVGYGTAAHQQAIRENGRCDLHRASFCKNII